ncbi:nucleoside kinase [Halarsenatibacter silvermanii]|uniref:Uridine kinase n=1 Tax=Halarsenatibacter silvermanii TaxID=321763 RepID=A0A1G9NW75_9FIRM|nr:nucleoside kinase [Halarsenatibacter silvermanii]SDL90621.1 uridine kinase [Halarsenatibacter silvermanii]
MISINIAGKSFSFKKGTALKEVFQSALTDNCRIVAAIVDSCIKNLNHELDSSNEGSEISPLNRGEELGNRVYRRSLFMLLARAVDELYPEGMLKIAHSLSNGVYCELIKNNSSFNQHDLKKIKIKMNELVDKDIPLEKKRLKVKDLKDIYRREALPIKVGLLERFDDDSEVSTYRLGDYYNYFYYPLVPSTGYLKKFELQYCMPGFVVLFPQSQDSDEVPDFVDQPKLANVFQEYERLGEILDVGYVNDLNCRITNGRHDELVRISEALHERKIAAIADEIYDKIEKRKIILIAGPSSSGKTTFTHRLATQLKVDGLNPVTISTDDYFVDRENTPRDEEGNPDFEALEAIKLDLFNEHLRKLIQGEEIELPEFNFNTGRREKSGQTLKIREEQPVLIEGIHGLNEELTPVIPQNQKFKIYVSALTQLNLDQHNRIPTSDTRLMRRIIRDYKYRGHDVERTLELWPNVRRGEERNIFPYQENADVTFNSALIYEPAVIKKYLLPLLKRVEEESPHYHEVKRLQEILFYLEPMPDLAVPQISILREFIGGSAFR